jgi:hypothetical protein
VTAASVAPTAPSSPSLARYLWTRRYAVVYLAALFRLVIEIGRFHDPPTGFSSLITFGDAFAPRRLPELADVPLYTYADSTGHDGQFYAQLAVAGNPFRADVGQALDSTSYRSRRILLPLVVHALGLGRPAWVIQIYALANLICLLVLAGLLARWWFPPTSLHNAIAWLGTLLGAGMIGSLTHSLTDGPALLVVAVGARLVEQNRALLGAAVLGAAGLCRETSVLAAGVFVPGRGQRGAWPRAAAAALLCVAPTALWAAAVSHHYGGGAGSRAFAPPFVGLAGKLGEIGRGLRAAGFDLDARTELFAVIALATQAGLVLLRPRVDLVWWRIGAAFALLSTVLGPAVWEKSPCAATRAVLPLTLAFNVLAPRTRRGLGLLVLGNLTVLSAFDILRVIPTEQTTFTHGVTARYADGFLAPEHLGRRTWRWSSGSATLVLENPTSRTLPATLSFQISSVLPRTVTVRAPATPADERSLSLPAQRRIPERFGPIALPPGDTPITFTTADPPWTESVASQRPLSFSIHDLYVTIGPAPP